MSAPISQDLPCVDCGYNLRGLAAVGNCPECGGRIQDSLWPAEFENFDPAWLNTLLRGCDLAARGLELIFVGCVIAAVTVILTCLDGGLALLVAAIALVINYAGVLVAARGLAITARPSPSLAFHGPLETARANARGAAVMLGVIGGLSPLAIAVRPLLWLLPPLLAILVTAISQAHARYLRRLCAMWGWSYVGELVWKVERSAATLYVVTSINLMALAGTYWARFDPLSDSSVWCVALAGLALAGLAIGVPVWAVALFTMLGNFKALHQEFKYRLTAARGSSTARPSPPRENETGEEGPR